MNTLHVLIPSDLSDATLATVNTLRNMMGENRELHVTLLHVVVPPEAVSPYADYIADIPNLEDKLVASAQKKLETLKAQLGCNHLMIDCLVYRGSPEIRVTQYLEENKVDLIAMPSHGRKGISRLLLGSVAEKILRVAKCPVLTIKAFEDD